MNTRAQAPRVPDRAAPEGLEAKWGEAWEDQGTYAFDRSATREQVYSIDTPPPTVSGSLHIGHVFSYTHTDVVARYQRMMGKSVFYPMGWDDNGLPTERRVQNYFGVRVDATLPYDPDFEPPHVGGDGKSIKARDQKPISRKNFVELCERLTQEDEAQFEALWRYLGLSVDWKQNYQTIGARARKVAQAAFLRNLARGEAYQAEAPGLWDVTFQTAVAQAELESREYPASTTACLPHHGRRGRREGCRRRCARRGRRGRCASRRRVPSCWPPASPDRPPGRRALQAAVRHDGRLPRVRRRGADPAPPRGRDRQGRGHRDVLYLR